MPISTSEPRTDAGIDGGARIKARLRERASADGFDAFGVARPSSVAKAGPRLHTFLSLGRHGDMNWMAAKADRRRHPNALWPAAQSVIVVGLSYAPAHDPLAALARPRSAAISVYAHGRDYHDVLGKRLKALARWMVASFGGEVKVFVDTAPVMEKPLAEAAGLGWQGKHTNLVSRAHGSWLFLGTIFTTLRLPADPPGQDHCGTCQRCLDVCPTDAFPAPYQLDARRCISYLTIEHKGQIDRALRPAIGNRIYGCDDCLAVCPWNKFARLGRDARLHARADLADAPLTALADLDDGAFRALFSGSPIKRTGRDRFVRNVMIALGNSNDRAVLATVRRRLDDPSPLVRAMAVWAFGRLVDANAFESERARRLPSERDGAVAEEWLAGKAA